MSEGTYIQKQITKYMTTKKLLEFNDKLRLPPLEYYAHVHANGDKNSSGKNVTSLIGITMLDYSNGKGDKTVSVEANITPDDLMFVLDNIRRGAQTYENSQDKIFGEPDKDGKCQVTKLSIKRSHNMNYPWCNDLVTILQADNLFAEVFCVEDKSVTFKDTRFCRQCLQN